jgi:carboxylesterase type B
MSETTEIILGALGTVRGQRRDGIESFLGIPYGTVTKRWTRAERVSSFANGYHDGRSYG